jgi:hypothetical protein
VANLDMVGRMIDAAGRTAAGYDPDQLARLAGLHDRIDAAMVVAIAGQRAAGVTWSSIGEALGVTKQAVIQLYGPKVIALARSIEVRWDQAERLGRGEAVPGGPGACASCHHGHPWHTPKTRRRPCERCGCPGYVAQAEMAS